jgi:hypothetical protein
MVTQTQVKARRRLTRDLPLHPLQIFRRRRLAEIFDVDECTIWRWRQNSTLPPFVKVGRVCGLTGEQVQEVLKQRMTG